MSDKMRKIVNFPVGIRTSTTASIGTDIPNLSQVQSLVSGLSNVKEAVAVDAHSDVDIATGSLLTIEGYTLVSGDRVLLNSQTDATENGIYVAAVGSWTRATDSDEAAELPAKTSVTVLNGTHAGRKYELQEDEPVVDTDVQTWVVTAASSSAALDSTVDDTNFTEISGTNAQVVFDSVDDTIVNLRSEIDTISGVNATDGDLGTFTGTTIADDQNIKQALQSLETAHESHVSDYNGDRFQSGVTTLTQSSGIVFNHALASQYLATVKVYESATGEDITSTVTIAMTDSNNLTITNDDVNVDVVVVARV